LTLGLSNIGVSYDGGGTFAVDVDGISVEEAARRLRDWIASSRR